METSKGFLFNGKTLSDIFSCNGRLSRGEYWFYFSLDILLISIYMVVSNFVFEKALSYAPGAEGIFGVIGNIFLFLPILFIAWSIMIGIMRLHDLGWKGLSILLLLVPLVNIGILFKMWFEGSEEGKNIFGLEPKKVKPYINMLSVVLIILGFLIFFYGMIYIGIHSMPA